MTLSKPRTRDNEAPLDEADLTKRCTGCGEVKPLFEYHRAKGRRDGRQVQCKVCQSASQKRRYAADKDKFRERGRASELANAAYLAKHGRLRLEVVVKFCHGCGTEKAASEFHKHKGRNDGLSTRCKACQKVALKQWRRGNPSRSLDTQRRYKEENRERYPEIDTAWRLANPGRVVAKTQKRRAHKLASPEHYTPEQWGALVNFYEDTCLCCGKQGQSTVDHVVALSAGGTNGIDNIQPLCFRCNRRKGVTSIDYRDPVLREVFERALMIEGLTSIV